MSTVPRSVRRQKHWGFPGAWMSLNSRVRNNFRFLMMKQFLRKNKCPLMKDERVTLTVTNGHTHLTHDPWTGTSRAPIRITGYLLFMWTHQHIHNHTLLLERPTLYTAKVEIKLYVKSGDIIKWQPQYRHDQITIFHIPLHELGFYSSKSILPCVQRIQDMDSIANDRGYSKWVGLTSPHYLSVTVTTVHELFFTLKRPWIPVSGTGRASLITAIPEAGAIIKHAVCPDTEIQPQASWISWVWILALQGHSPKS